MPNEYRKKGSSAGRVGYDESVGDKLKKAEKGELKAEKPSFMLPGKKLPASAATRQEPLPKAPKTPSVQPKPINTAPHFGNSIEKYYKKVTQ